MSVKYDPLSTVPGYACTRSGAKSELGSTGTPIAFAANVPGVVPNKGYWSRVALTNVVLHSQSFDNAWWTKDAITVTADAVVAPDGTTTADTLTVNATSAVHRVYSTVLASSIYGKSIFVKAGTASFISLSAGASGTAGVFNLATGVVVSSAGVTATITPCGNGWYRCHVYDDAATAYTSLSIGTTAATANPDLAWLGAGETVHVWQSQAYAGGNFPDGGPIIATTTAAATVGADVLDVSASLPAGDFIVWAVADVKNGTGPRILVELNSVSVSDRLIIYINGANGPFLTVIAAGVGVADMATGSTQLIGRMAILARYSAGKYKLYSRNLGTGAENASAETTAPIPAISRGQIGHVVGGQHLNSPIEGVYQRNGTFTDAEISSILAAS